MILSLYFCFEQVSIESMLSSRSYCRNVSHCQQQKQQQQQQQQQQQAKLL